MAGPSSRGGKLSASAQLASSAQVFKDLEDVPYNIEEMYPPRVLKHVAKHADAMNAPLGYFTNSLPCLFANSMGVSVVRKSQVR